MKVNVEVTCTPEEARARLGVEGRRVVTLLGFIYGRKGHKPTVEAIPMLPEDVVVVFAGGPVAGKDKVIGIVRRRHAELGLGDRLRITGYLAEEEMEAWIAATEKDWRAIDTIAGRGIERARRLRAAE